MQIILSVRTKNEKRSGFDDNFIQTFERAMLLLAENERAVRIHSSNTVSLPVKSARRVHIDSIEQLRS